MMQYIVDLDAAENGHIERREPGKGVALGRAGIYNGSNGDNGQDDGYENLSHFYYFLVEWDGFGPPSPLHFCKVLYR